MTTPLPRTTSDTARLMVDAPSFAVGWQELRRLANPAAGTVFTYKADGRYYERVLAVSFTFTASAVVASRFLSLALFDNNNVMVTEVPAAVGTTAGNSVLVNLVRGGPAYSGGNSGITYGFMPDLMIPPDWYWSLSAFGLDVGDQLSGVTLLVQRFPNDAAVISAIS